MPWPLGRIMLRPCSVSVTLLPYGNSLFATKPKDSETICSNECCRANGGAVPSFQRRKRDELMNEVTVRRAIVLAAGTGSRLRAGSNQTPKPMRPVGGVPLLVRVLRTLAAAGIREAVIVTGYEGDRIREMVESEPELGLAVTFVHNQRYEAKNGVSLLAAAEYVEPGCVLTMADHLYSPDLVRRLLDFELDADACALAVDTNIGACFDIDDATKVRAEAGRIRRIGKELADYNALDTGVFRIGPALLTELALVEAKAGDCSLSDGVQALARLGRFYAADVGPVRWIDVDTPVAVEQAEMMLRVFGDELGAEPHASPTPVPDPGVLLAFAPSWVRAAAPYNEGHFAVADRQQDVVRMMSNESAFAPSPRVLQAVLETAMRGHLYPGAAPDALRQRLAEREGFQLGSVLLGAGSTELIDVIIRSFVAPGEEVVLSVPTFSMYEARTRVVGGTPVLVPMTEEHGHDIPRLVQSITERTKVIFLCTPNNPTGTQCPEADLRRVLAMGLPTVIDEAYYEFGSRPSFAPLLREYPNAIVLRTFSKAFGLAGMRVGYALAHEEVIRILQRVKIPWNLPSVTIAAALAVLEDGDEFASRMSELRQARVDLEGALHALPGLQIVPGEGNFILIDVSDLGVRAEEFVAAVLEHGVLIRALGSHHAKRSYVRVTVGRSADNTRCVRAFRAVVAGLLPRQVAPNAPNAPALSDAE